MEGSSGLRLLVSVLLVLGSAFFVVAEYSLVSARKSRLESLAKRGSASAKRVLVALDDLGPYIAGTQIGITMLGIGIGSFTEPFVTELLVKNLSWLDHRVSHVLSFMLVVFCLVVLGELCPKYLALRSPEKIALLTFRPLRWTVKLLYPIIWLAQLASKLTMRLFGVKSDKSASEAVSKDELLMMIQTGGEEGVLDKSHADFVTRALKLDVLMARDIMIHRLDMKWLDASLDRDELLKRLKLIPYTRVPICKGDIDELVAIVYLHDIVKHLDDTEFSLEKIGRPYVAIPENLRLGRIVETMRSEKTQMLIVMDEYGGTSGLVTLEDVVEEVFGELEDRLESERPPIELFPNGRVSARADTRYDELIDKLELPLDAIHTQTLATMMVEALERVPRPGDSVESSIGTMRVENMARRRVTRVSIQLKPELAEVSQRP